MHAFEIYMSQLHCPTDVLTVLACTREAEDPNTLLAEYKDIMTSAKASGSCVCKKMSPGQTAADAILQFAEEHGVDLIAVGTSSYSDQRLGSVSEDISVRAPCTTLVIKDRKDDSNLYANAGVRTLSRHLMPSMTRRSHDLGSSPESPTRPSTSRKSLRSSLDFVPGSSGAFL